MVYPPPFEDTVAGKGWADAGTDLRAAAAIADRVFGDFVKSSDLSSPDHVRALAGAVAAGLNEAGGRLSLPAFALPLVVEALALRATTSFLDGDLFAAMVRFLGDAHGSFGLTACCSLDRSVACIASRGQAMCLSFSAEAGAVLWGSEAATQASRKRGRLLQVLPHSSLSKSSTPSRPPLPPPSPLSPLPSSSTPSHFLNPFLPPSL